VIHVIPTDLEVGAYVDTDEREGLGAYDLGFSGLPAKTWAQR